MTEHDVFFDRKRWVGYSRWTCKTCNKTCIRASWMNLLSWADKVEEFAKNHPNKQLIEYAETMRSSHRKIHGDDK